MFNSIIVSVLQFVVNTVCNLFRAADQSSDSDCAHYEVWLLGIRFASGYDMVQTYWAIERRNWKTLLSYGTESGVFLGTRHLGDI